MDGFTFVEGLFKSLTTMIGAFAWPAAIFGIVWLFKDKLNELLPFLILKYKDFEVSFKYFLGKAEEQVRGIPTQEPTEEEASKSAEERSRFEEVAKTSPREAIFDAFVEISDVLQDFARTADLRRILGGGDLSYWTLVQELRRQSLINQPAARALMYLRDVRNSVVARDLAPSEEDAIRYCELAVQLITYLSIEARAARMPPPGPIPPGMP
jgi:hypothetical protein